MSTSIERFQQIALRAAPTDFAGVPTTNNRACHTNFPAATKVGGHPSPQESRWLPAWPPKPPECPTSRLNRLEELAASHCPMPPVLPTERIAHPGTADCCIHPPGRNGMIAITPPIISSKEVAQKQAPPFPRQDLLTARNRF